MAPVSPIIGHIPMHVLPSCEEKQLAARIAALRGKIDHLVALDTNTGMQSLIQEYKTLTTVIGCCIRQRTSTDAYKEFAELRIAIKLKREEACKAAGKAMGEVDGGVKGGEGCRLSQRLEEGIADFTKEIVQCESAQNLKREVVDTTVGEEGYIIVQNPVEDVVSGISDNEAYQMSRRLRDEVEGR